MEEELDAVEALPGVEAALVRDAAKLNGVGYCWSWAESDGDAPPSQVEVHVCRALCTWASLLSVGPHHVAPLSHLATLDAYESEPAVYQDAVRGVMRAMVDFFLDSLPDCVVTRASPAPSHLVDGRHQDLVRKLLQLDVADASPATLRAALLAVYQYAALNMAFVATRVRNCSSFSAFLSTLHSPRFLHMARIVRPYLFPMF